MRYWLELAKTPKGIIGIIIATTFLWFLLGVFKSSHHTDNHHDEGRITKIRAIKSVAVQEMANVMVYGTSVASKKIQIKTETAGEIMELPVLKGTFVQKGKTIAVLSLDTRSKQLSAARSALEVAEKDYKIAQTMAEKNFSSETRLTQAKSAYERAIADLARIEKDVGDTSVRAPFAGILQNTLINIGDYVQAGMPVAELLDLSQVKVRVFVSEKDYGSFKIGSIAKVKFSNNIEKTGEVIYISSSADENTRTYGVDVLIKDNDENIPDGLTSAVMINTKEVLVHKIYPSSLTMDENDKPGVKVVDDQSKVTFYPVEFVKSEGEFIWVSGLTENANIITVGGDFVSPGDKVQVTFEENTTDKK